MIDDKYQYFLEDLVNLLKEKIQQAYADKQKAENNDKIFLQGEIQSLYTVLDLIKSQALAFDIPLDKINILNFDLEKYLY